MIDLQVGVALVAENLAEAVSQLIKQSTDDVGKVRALYMWVTSHGVVGYRSREVPEPSSVLYQLLLCKGGIYNRNHVFSLLCK